MYNSIRCALALTAVLSFVPGSHAQEFSMDTTYASGNGQSGNMFDVRAEIDLMITRVDAHIDAGSTTVEIYTSPGGYAGKTTSLAAWNLIGSVPVTGLGDVSTGGQKTPIPINLDIPMAAGETLGFYVTTTASLINYTNGSSEGALYKTDGQLSFFEGVGVAYPTAGTYTPRIWNGTIYYIPAGGTEQQGYQEVYKVGGPAASSGFGSSLASLADVGFDSFPGFAVGSPAYLGGVGQVQVRRGMTGAIQQTINGSVTDAAFGTAVASAGDADGDGKDDLLIGAPGKDSSSPAYVYLYSNGAILPTHIKSGPVGSSFGAALASIGDLDGDLKDDFLVGAPDFSSLAGVKIGSFTLFSGGSGAVLHEAESEVAGDHMGSSVTGLGDVDGDGTPDWLVGSQGASQDPLLGDNKGRVEVWSGATKSVLYEVFGYGDGSEFGGSVVDLGDVTGDGVHDFAVGAPQESLGLGAAHGFSGADGAPLWSLTGSEPLGHLGATLALLGDVDGDGQADLAIGAPGDVDLWGYAEIVRPVSGAPITTVVQGSLNTEFGIALAALGDVDGDGLDEFLVGSPVEYDQGKIAAGVVRAATTLSKPQVHSVVGVHALDSGEYVLTGTSLVSPTVFVDGVLTSGTSVNPTEYRIPVAPVMPGGFHDLRVVTSEGAVDQDHFLPRYPALHIDPTVPYSDPVTVELSNGDEGIYILALSGGLYPSPAPFTSFGWYHGLELNGVWIVASGVFTTTETAVSLVLPGSSSLSLIGVPVHFQALTSQVDHGSAGFTKTVTVVMDAIP